ncbi:hypothetical protein T492DRAFT_1099552 [Pavlovales sp. CCMP2436]|nr:hypothetical protein T492DRAFT_1099552 [Pavlovales sp. CCMP2436]|mmetsp:Transcript_51314/g.120542  ORF Transcript_51314/g.120542 Transcript_51314/m.120542 type:complete len:260 (+) Transcript_51314:49-828(+)
MAQTSAVYYERLLELKDEQLALKTKLSVAAATPQPDPSQRAQKALVQSLTRERDEWRAISERPGGPARELDKLRRENRAQALWIDAHARALMDVGSLSRRQVDEAVRAQVAKQKGVSQALVQRTTHTTRGAPRGVFSPPAAGAARRLASTPRSLAAGRAAAATAASESEQLRARLLLEARRSESLIETYSSALAEERARGARSRELELDMREAEIERRLQREAADMLRADYSESEQENAALRREVRVLQQKLVSFLTSG